MAELRATRGVRGRQGDRAAACDAGTIPVAGPGAAWAAGAASLPSRPAGTSSGVPQSAVLLPAPDAEALVRPWRRIYDPVAAAGVPAHVTLVVPWIPSESISAADLAGLEELAAGTEPWEYQLTRVAWFGERVLWLAPEPAEPFCALTAAISGRFGTPPWDGAFDEVVPHLTVAHAEGHPSEVGSLAGELAARLPVTCRATEVWVMVAEGRHWSVRHRCRLGDGSGAASRPGG